MLDANDSRVVQARLAAVLAELSAPLPAPLKPLDPLPGMAMARGRVHEVTGSARHVLAAALAAGAQAEGPVLWLQPAWSGEELCPQGLVPFVDPGALITVACPRASDILWAAEEALCSGAVALVLAALIAAPDLRQVRRLHRAAAEGVVRARDGAGAGRRAPLGVLMMQEQAESRIAGVESRWALQALPPLSEGTRWQLERLLARDAPPAGWTLQMSTAGLKAG